MKVFSEYTHIRKDEISTKKKNLLYLTLNNNNNNWIKPFGLFRRYLLEPLVSRLKLWRHYFPSCSKFNQRKVEYLVSHNLYCNWAMYKHLSIRYKHLLLHWGLWIFHVFCLVLFVFRLRLLLNEILFSAYLQKYAYPWINQTSIELTLSNFTFYQIISLMNDIK